MSINTEGHSGKQPLAPIWVGVAICLFFPVGLFLLWKHPTLSRNGKWWAAGLTWAVLGTLVGSQLKSETKSPPMPEAEQSGGTRTPSTPVEHPTDTERSGELFSDEEMEDLYRKAFKLRLGMSENEVLRIMGQPTERKTFDPSQHTVPGLPVVDPRVLNTSTWSSAKNSGSEFIMVTVTDDRAVDIVAHKKGGAILELSELR